VAAGARLDPGVDPHARLIEVMPRFPQPTPPEHYPAPVPITALAFSPDGAVLAASGYHEVLLWDAADGTLRQRLTNVAQSVEDLAFHPDGTRLAVAAGTPGQSGEAKVFALPSGELLADLVRTEDSVFGVAFSPDGGRLATCGADRSIRLFDVSSGAPIVTIEDHADWVLDVAWSPDGERLASASRDKTAKYFNAHTGDALGTFNGHGDIVYGAAFLPDGKLVATCGADKLIRLWKVDDFKEVRKLDGAGGDVFELRVLADGRLVSVSGDRQGRIYQSGDGKLLHTLSGHAEWVYAVAVHPESQRLATGSGDGMIRLWNLEDGQLVREWRAAP
jgi:WD40 repeat protein